MKRFSLTTLLTAALLVVLVGLLCACGSSSDNSNASDTSTLGLPANSTPVQQTINSTANDNSSQQNQQNQGTSSNSDSSQQAQGFTIDTSSIQLESAQGTDSYGNSYSDDQIMRFLQDDIGGSQFYLPQGSTSNLYYHNDYFEMYCSVDLSSDTINVTSYTYSIRSGVLANGEGGNGGTSGFTVSFTASIQTF